MKKGIFILMLLAVLQVGAQSPHGPNLKLDCSACHTADGWEIALNSMDFDHGTTGFPLKGQHKQIDCELCHTGLVFDEAKSKISCNDCHTDVHQQTVGFDCEQCHSTSTWIIENTMNLHRQSRFPLLGSHALADCRTCHESAPNLQFPTLGIDCYDCHKTEYEATTQPNHIEEGYSTNCIECHSVKAYEWTASGFNHDFFPLTGGHRGPTCSDCHGENKFEKVSAECFDCHQVDFEQASNPVHDPASFSTQCDQCHTTDPGWKPARFDQHDAEAFPIYSGSHRGEWKSCAECHENPDDYGSFTCISCHTHGKVVTDLEHREERDYKYESSACYDCHPRGRAEDD